MKKYILILAILTHSSLFAGDIAQNTQIPQEQVQAPQVQFAQPPQDLIKTVQQGKLKVETPYKDGLVHGIEKWTQEAQKLDFQMPLENNDEAMNNKWLENPDKVLREVSYKNGIKDGIEKQFHENGIIKKEIPYKKGMKDGVEKAYFEDGTLRYEITYKNGKAIVGFKYTVSKAEMTNDDFFLLDSEN